MKLDQRGSAILGEDACRDHLAREATASGVGRVAVNGDQSPYVIPVNFTVVDGGILIRLGPGWAAFHLDGSAVTFEADQAKASSTVAGVSWSKGLPTLSRTTTSDASVPICRPQWSRCRGSECSRSSRSRSPGAQSNPIFEMSPVALRPTPPMKPRAQPSGLRLTPESAHELAVTLRSAHWEVDSKIADTDDPVARETLLERRRLLEGLAAQLAGAGA